MPAPAITTAPRDAAPALAALLRHCVEAGVERAALHLRLSDLAPRLDRSHHRRLLREALEPLQAGARGRLFELANGDLVAVAPQGEPHLLAAEAALATLLAGAPLAPGQVDRPAVTHLRLPAEGAALMAAMEAALTPSRPPTLAAAAPRFDLTDLAAIERGLAGACLAVHLHRRPVCRLHAGDPAPALAWEEVWLDTAAVCRALRPGADPDAAPALARRLRGLLQRRLLHELARPQELRGPGFGLCLDPETVTDPAFLRLDAALGAAARARVVVGLPAAALLEDTAAWTFAARFLRARGYRVALDRPALGMLGCLRLEQLGVALIRLRWQPGPPLHLPAGLAPETVVLTGADQAAAIGSGWEAGISLFEGRLLRPG